VSQWAPRVANGLVLVALVILLILVLPATWSFLTAPGGASTVVAAVVVNVGALGIGHLMAGPDRTHSIVLALSCASRHPALALSIATANYPSTNVAVAVIVVQIINGIVCPLYLRRLRPTTRSAGGAPASAAA
jgi:BASS family bile acid:Na+ symporter